MIWPSGSGRSVATTSSSWRNASSLMATQYSSGVLSSVPMTRPTDGLVPLPSIGIRPYPGGVTTLGRGPTITRRDEDGSYAG